MSNISNHPFTLLVNDIISTAKPKPVVHDYVIINANDGTVTSLEGSYIVDLNAISDFDKEVWAGWVSGGDDSIASAIAHDYGTPIADFVE